MLKKEPVRISEAHGKKSVGIFFEGKVLERRRSRYQEILVLDNADYGRVLLLDGMVMTTERDAPFYHEPLVHPVMTHHPEPLSVLVVGGGDGGTVTELVKYDRLERILVVEIDAEVIETSQRWLPELSRGFDDARVEVLNADAAEYLAQEQERFDVILCDGADPVGPASVLFSGKFYSDVAARLTPRGMFVTQLQGPLFYRKQIREALGRMARAFDWYCPWPAVVPTYPGAVWCFTWAGRGERPRGPVRTPPVGLVVYNPAAAPPAEPEALPGYLKELVPGT